MSYPIRFTNAAAADLAHLSDYLASQFGQESTKKILRKLQKSIYNLSDFPQMGKSATVFNPDLVNVYLLIHEKNVILYRINKSVGSIDILRLFGTREDYSEKIRRLLDE